MKKLVKFLCGVAVVAGAIGGVLFLLKNVCGQNDFDDDFDDDLDEDLFEPDDDNREYVTLDLDEETKSEDDADTSSEEDTATES